MHSLRFLLLGALLLGAAACRDSATATLDCESDADCTVPGTRCDTDTRLCVCTTDEACLEGFFCNNAGVCQALGGCGNNTDCAEGSFCDVVSGKCLSGTGTEPDGSCGLASHCPFGTICEGGLCVPGCFDDGDCVLGEVCFDGVCAGGADVCSSDAFCEYGQVCDAFTCKDDRSGPYCRGCSQRGPGNPNPCDHPRNFCLLNNQEVGGAPLICGVDCSLQDNCPNGFGCTNVIILTQTRCFNQAECQCPIAPRPSGVCTVATPCEPASGEDRCRYDPHPDCGDGACTVATGTTTGSCLCGSDTDCGDDSACVSELCCDRPEDVREERACRGGEGAVFGFCTCATDNDCPPDTCNPQTSACAITGHPCTPGAGDCPVIPCVNGGCRIGQNCAPETGLSCSAIGGR